MYVNNTKSHYKLSETDFFTLPSTDVNTIAYWHCLLFIIKNYKRKWHNERIFPFFFFKYPTAIINPQISPKLHVLS